MRASINLALVLAVLAAGHRSPEAADTLPRRLSFHNRLLLNRAVLAGLDSIEVLVLATDDRPSFALAEVSALVQRLGGRVRRTDAPIGYLRVEVPTQKFLQLADSTAVAGCQISSLSRAAWYRDGPPLSNADMYRGFETAPVAVPQTDAADPTLPPLTVAESRASGFTLDEDAGVGAWMKAHPTFDGRGVTIALIENAMPDFMQPGFRTAKTIDGREIPKIAGILNAIDPDQPDETRVWLNEEVSATTSWARVHGRTYILPHPGRYRLGLLELPGGGNVVHEFGVVESLDTDQIWIDGNGDASFADETPLVDVNDRFDPRYLDLVSPARIKVCFVMSRAPAPHTIHIYYSRGAHQTMTMSVAAGAMTSASLAYGVAPGARVLLVRSITSQHALTGEIEAYIAAAKHPDVDVVNASAGIDIITNTGGDFIGILFSRLQSVYRKPIINAAGNHHLQLGSSFAFGSSWTVGGVLGAPTLAALHGGRQLEGLIVHPYGAAGPALDGAIKPDFLAPMERLAADLPWNHQLKQVPENRPTRSVPPGYQVSCCTSSTSPYAAGLVALLISAAKQSAVAYSPARMDRALKLSARFIEGFPSHEQGNGAVDIGRAWEALKTAQEPSKIIAAAKIVHPLAQYAARGDEGTGIFEFEGWSAGSTGTRSFRFRRESGSNQPLTYDVIWTGNDGTFTSARSVTLPLGTTVTFPVTIRLASPGTHSALLDLREPTSGTSVFRTQATIVASERPDPATGSLRVSGRAGLMRVTQHYFHVPAGTAAVGFELDVSNGVVKPTILPSHGLFPGYYLHVHPMNVRSVGKGRHSVMLPNPEPGTWTVQLENTSIGGRFGPDDVVPTDDSDAEYVMTLRTFGAAVDVQRAPGGALEVSLRNTGSTIREPVVTASLGTLRVHRDNLEALGLPNLVEISVPEAASALLLHLRSEQPETNAVELLLYDCTTGECFSYDLGFPAAASHEMVVRNPRPGRWIAAVDTAPFATASGSFVLDEIITTAAVAERRSTEPRPPGARWTESLALDESKLPPRRDGSDIVLVELFDAALARDEAEYPWIVGPNPRVLRDRPIALGRAVYRR
jgi:hypothetical protein